MNSAAGASLDAGCVQHCMKPGQHSQAVVDVVMLQPHIFLPQHHSSTMLLATHNILNCQLAALLLPLLLVVLSKGRKRRENRWQKWWQRKQWRH